MGTLILPDFLIAVPGERPLPGWGVRIVADTVDATGPHAALLARFPDDEIVAAPGQALAPGFVDAHTHLYGVLSHGIPMDQAPEGFWPFLEQFWWPRIEDRLDHEMIEAAADAACCEMIRSGITAFYDCLEAPNALPGGLDAEAAAVRRRGLRGILSFEATERAGPENGQLGLRENAGFTRARKLLKDPLLSGLICFHTTFTCSSDFIQQAFTLGEELDVPVHMHLSEGTYEPEHCLQHYGVRPVRYYEQLGVLGPRMLASQCVQIDGDEIGLLAERGVRTTHMPLSNCEVGGGIAPVPEMLAAGITMGLGSDGYVRDFFEVMRGAFLIHKAAHQDPRVMPAGTVWRMATEGGAQALGLERVGRLEPGWQADLQLIDCSLPTPVTVGNLYDQLLLYRNRSHVRGVMVAGEWRMRDGVLDGVDEDAVRERCHAAARRLWEA